MKRRADVIGIFPNKDSINRLVGTVLLEQNLFRKQLWFQNVANSNHWPSRPRRQFPQSTWCVTGNCALTRALDLRVVAPVFAHPTFPLPLSTKRAAAQHVTPETLDNETELGTSINSPD